jgi:hypothetical protein
VDQDPLYDNGGTHMLVLLFRGYLIAISRWGGDEGGKEDGARGLLAARVVGELKRGEGRGGGARDWRATVVSGSEREESTTPGPSVYMLFLLLPNASDMRCLILEGDGTSESAGG